MRIQIGGGQVNALHRFGITLRDFCEWSKEIVSKAAWRCEDAKLLARGESCLELRLDLFRENLQAVINRAMK
jgi:hypothetical protein